MLTKVPLQGKQYHCYMSAHISIMRIVLDTPILLYVVMYNSWRAFDQRWNDAYDSLWLHMHMAMVLFEAGALPPSFTNNVVCLERMHMHAYRFISSMAMIIDLFMVILTADDVGDHGSDGDFISRLVLVLLLMAVNIWRTAEIWSNVSVHTTAPPESLNYTGQPKQQPEYPNKTKTRTRASSSRITGQVVDSY